MKAILSELALGAFIVSLMAVFAVSASLAAILVTIGSGWMAALTALVAIFEAACFLYYAWLIGHYGLLGYRKGGK